MVSKETIGRRAPDEGALGSIALVVGLMMVMTVMASVTFSSDVNAGEVPLTDLVVHSPVAIDKNDGLAASDIVTNGNGTWDNPYIIEGWTINATGSANGIMISNTNSSIIIRDCNMSYANGGGYEDRSGLRLVNVTNATVVNITAYMNTYNGIKLDECGNITITGCRLIDNGILTTGDDGNGIKVHSCVDLSIEDCDVIGNERHGLYFTSQYSRACTNISLINCDISGSMRDIWTYSNMMYGFTIENCTISEFSTAGIWMRDEIGHPRQTGWVIRNTTIENDDNVQTDCAICLSELTGALIENLVVSHVFASDGIVRLTDCDNSTIVNSSFQDSVGTMVQIGNQNFLGHGCQNTTLRDSAIVNGTQYGIYVHDSVDTTISGVTIEERGGSSGRGIQIDYATRTGVQGCVISNCSHHGIYVSVHTDHLLVRDCIISNNGDAVNQYGVYITTGIENVTVVNNTFTNNNGAGSIYDADHIQAYDAGNNNAWNDSEGGNRWSDWLGPDADYDGFVDVPYDIVGAAGAQDMLPLADSEEVPPEVVITAPGDGAVLASTDVTVEWGAWDNQTGLDRIEVTVDSDAPADVGLNTSMELSLSEGAHTVMVTAYDAMGNDGSDSISFSIVLPTVPGTPTSLTATPSDSSVLLGWTAPSNGGSAITAYHVYRGTDPGSLSEVGTSNGTSYSDGGLVNGITYHYALSAENSVGEGLQSDVVNVTPANVPGTPTNLTILVNGTSIELTWEVPEDNGSDIDHYNIYHGTTGTLTKIGESTVSSFIDTGLDGGVTYRYQVSAVNSVGEGLKSQEVQATVVDVPDAPLNLELTLTDDAVNVGWDAPTSDSGSTVVRYNIYRGLSTNDLTLIGNTSALFYDDTGLASGTTYYYAVSAVNSIGEGERCAIANITTVAMPGVPQNPQAEEMDNGIMLTWSAPTGEQEITGYRIYRGLGSGGMTLLTTVNETEYLDTDVQDNTTYNYVIRAVNSAGEGEATSQFSIIYHPFLPEDDDGGLQWYIFLIPIVLVLVLLFLVLWARKRKDKGEGEEGAQE